MAVIYLRHPIHGAKVASLDLEALNDEMNGWERYEPSESAPSESAPSEPKLEDSAPIVRRGRRKQADDSAQFSEEL